MPAVVQVSGKIVTVSVRPVRTSWQVNLTPKVLLHRTGQHQQKGLDFLSLSGAVNQNFEEIFCGQSQKSFYIGAGERLCGRVCVCALQPEGEKRNLNNLIGTPRIHSVLYAEIACSAVVGRSGTTMTQGAS